MEYQDAKKWVELHQAYENGVELQYESGVGVWVGLNGSPSGCELSRVRIKKEPKVIWVNEYEDGCHTAGNSEGMVEANAMNSAIRVAVKYIEAVD